MNQQEAIEAARKMGLSWVAMDDDGRWYGFTEKPQRSGGSWYRPESIVTELNEEVQLVNRGTMHYLGAQDIIPTPEPIEVRP